MELLFFVMNQIDKLDQLLKDLSNEKKFSATIIDSAARSFTEPAGLLPSSLTQTSLPLSGPRR